MGASDSGAPEKLCSGLGDLSYPLYTIHYPLIYLLFMRMGFNGELFDKSAVTPHWPLAVCLVLLCILLAWLLMTYYERPVRRLLSTRWKNKRTNQ